MKTGAQHTVLRFHREHEGTECVGQGPIILFEIDIESHMRQSFESLFKLQELDSRPSERKGLSAVGGEIKSCINVLELPECVLFNAAGAVCSPVNEIIMENNHLAV
jgi:hypothetical protein